MKKQLYKLKTWAAPIALFALVFNIVAGSIPAAHAAGPVGFTVQVCNDQDGNGACSDSEGVAGVIVDVTQSSQNFSVTTSAGGQAEDGINDEATTFTVNLTSLAAALNVEQASINGSNTQVVSADEFVENAITPITFVFTVSTDSNEDPGDEENPTEEDPSDEDPADPQDPTGPAPTSNVRSLVGYVFFDDNNNGGLYLEAEGDEPLANIPVLISRVDGTGDPIPPATTNVDGRYTFTDLPFGEYAVSVDPTCVETRCGALANANPDREITLTTNNSPQTITVNEHATLNASGFIPVSSIGYHWTELPTADIRGNVFYDSNADGGAFTNGTNDRLLGGIRVVLSGYDALGRMVRQEVTTALSNDNIWSLQQDGVYIFPNIPQGTYQLMVDRTCLADACGDFSLAPSGSTITQTSGPETQDIRINDDGTITNITNGGTGSQIFQMGYHWDGMNDDSSQNIIEGTIFFDRNGDGIMRSSEGDYFLTTTQIQLVRANDGTVVAETLTSNGIFRIPNVTSENSTHSSDNDNRNYIVRANPEWITNGIGPFVNAEPGTVELTTPVGGQGQTVVVDADGLVLQQPRPLGYTWQIRDEVVGSYSNQVFYDSGNNGGDFIPELDHPLAGIPVILESRDGSNQNFEAITNANGTYRFNGIPVGEYNLLVNPACYNLPRCGDFQQASDNEAVRLTTGNSPQIITVLPDGRIRNSLSGTGLPTRFGFHWVPQTTVDVSGHIFYDANSDRRAVEADNDRPLGGIRVILEGHDEIGNPVRRETVSQYINDNVWHSSDGFFYFRSVPVGTYQLYVDPVCFDEPRCGEEFGFGLAPENTNIVSTTNSSPQTITVHPNGTYTNNISNREGTFHMGFNWVPADNGNGGGTTDPEDNGNGNENPGGGTTDPGNNGGTTNPEDEERPAPGGGSSGGSTGGGSTGGTSGGGSTGGGTTTPSDNGSTGTTPDEPTFGGGGYSEPDQNPNGSNGNTSNPGSGSGTNTNPQDNPELNAPTFGGGGYGSESNEDGGTLPETGANNVVWNMVLGMAILGGLSYNEIRKHSKKVSAKAQK